MGTARVPRLPAGLPSTAPPGTGGTGADCTLPRRPRTTTSQTPAGDIPRGGVRSAPAGDSPRVRGQDSRPRRRRTSPPATTCPRPRRMSPDSRNTPVRSVGPDHEWGTHTDRPLRRTSSDRHASPSNHHGPTNDTNKRPRTSGSGPAGVAAPVQAGCSLSGDECGRHPSGTPNPERGHRTSSVGGILLPDPPS